MVRPRHNRARENVMSDQKLDMYKSLTDNVLHCREFIQTIGPGPAMTQYEAAVEAEVKK